MFARRLLSAMQLPGQQDNQAEDGHQRDQDDRDDRGRQMQDGRRTHTGIFVSSASAFQKVDRGESPGEGAVRGARTRTRATEAGRCRTPLHVLRDCSPARREGLSWASG